MSPETQQTVDDLGTCVEANLGFLAPPESTWHPTDFLPSMGDGWQDALAGFRARCAGLSDDLLVVLCGNTITEEALPAYHSWLSNLEGGLDPTGVGEAPLCRWTRYWVADEQKHGSVLSRFLYLSGRVNMNEVESTVQSLIRNGFDASTGRDMHKGFVYTSLQEAATRIAHGNVAKLARKEGCDDLGRMLEAITADEARHETAYQRFVSRLLELDGDRCVVAMAGMVERGIVMPGRKMDEDAGTGSLFSVFSAIAQRLRVYTTRDYVEIIDRNLRRWNIFEKTFQGDEANRAQERLHAFLGRLKRLADRAERQSAIRSCAELRWLMPARLATA